MTKQNFVLLAYMAKKIEKDTWTMLETENYDMGSFKISYDGITIDIPMEYAETNNDVTVFLEYLMDSFREYAF